MTANPYIFLQKKTFTTALNHYLAHTEMPCFIVNHLAHIYFIAEINKKTSFIAKNIQKTHPILCILSPRNAVSYTGARWWISFTNKAATILPTNTMMHILDCYDHAGLAMAALRIGQKHILFQSQSPQFETLKNRASTVNACIIASSPDSFSLLELPFKKKSAFCT